MKKLLLSILSLGTLSVATSQCTDIFISEYVEGTYNNKAIELYNPTSSPISLTGYELRRYSNGGTTTPSDKILALGGTIPAKSTYVIVIDRRDPNATGNDVPVWDCLQALADTFMCDNYNVNNVMNFNGNDVMALVNGSSVVDFFGVLGQDPSGGAWPDSNATDGLTADHTLIRRRSIQGGVTVPVAIATNSSADFNPRIEWHDAGRNRFRNLGTHECNCDVVGTTVTIDTTYGCNTNTGTVTVNDAYSASIDKNNIEEVNFSVYPNPSNTGNITITADKAPVHVKVFNVLGTVVYEAKANNNNIQYLNTNNWTKGLYFVSLRFENGTESTKKVTIN